MKQLTRSSAPHRGTTSRPRVPGWRRRNAMSSTPRFVAQEQSDSCAIACLRMILAAQGIERTEQELIDEAGMTPGGLDPEECAWLAQRYGLRATEQQLDRRVLFDLIDSYRFPIVFLHRRPIDQENEVHAVVAVRTSGHYVTFLDPLRGQRRVTIRKFEQARRLIGQWVIVWEKRKD